MIMLMNSSFSFDMEVCDVNVTLSTCLSFISSARSERSIQRLIKLRNSVMRSYQDCKIPVDWMLDSGIGSKVCFFSNEVSFVGLIVISELALFLNFCKVTIFKVC